MNRLIPTHGMLATLMAAALFLFAFAPAMAAVPAATAATARLENLHIDIWPEYDRPAALVILRGQLPKEATLPATLSLRLPASSGGPAAVAYGMPDKPDLFDLQYSKSDGKDFITVRFTVPERVFHIEFYDPFSTSGSKRSYRYVWPGDMAVDQASVLIQEPAMSSGFSVKPEVSQQRVGPDSLVYRTADLGALPAGKPFPIEVRYTKTDSRTSAEILKQQSPGGPPGQASAAAGGVSGGGQSLQLLLVLGVIVPLIAAAIIGLVWWRQRPRQAAAGKGFCTKCGNRLATGDRFCSKCGAPVA